MISRIRHFGIRLFPSPPPMLLSAYDEECIWVVFTGDGRVRFFGGATLPLASRAASETYGRPVYGTWWGPVASVDAAWDVVREAKALAKEDPYWALLTRMVTALPVKGGAL